MSGGTLKLKSVTAVLNTIYSDYVNVDAEEMKDTRQILRKVFNMVITEMCKQDPIFKRMYRKTTIAGSVGDCLKIHLPDEYDLNVLLDMSKCYTTFPANIPGYIHVKEKDNVDDVTRSKYLPKWMQSPEDAYVLPKNLLSWFQSLLARALETFKSCDDGVYKIPTKYKTFFITRISQIQPGFTLKLEVNEDDVSVDVVPCFMCPCNSLPEYYRNRIAKGICLIIPKITKRDVPYKERYWRLSFHDYERKMLHHRFWLKPTIKLLKVLKERLQIDSAICSYHIKSLCLYEMRRATDEFWKTTLSYCFLYLLKSCIEHVKARNIPAVYNDNCNLIEHVKPANCENVSSQLMRVYEAIVSNADPRIVAVNLLEDEDLEEFESDFVISKKYQAVALKHYNVDLTQPIDH